MDPTRVQEVLAAEVVLPCPQLLATQRFFTEVLGFRVEAVMPADDPREVVVAGHGLRVRLDRDATGAPGVLRVLCRDPVPRVGGATELRAPNGTRVLLAAAEPVITMPPLRPALVLSRAADAAWVPGRAGMRYRDLLPGRQGGRFAASLIAIPDGGPVPDYPHHHRVRFQVICCVAGWVRVVYEDQGAPFVLRAGDCVSQPPGIGHRVLECSPGLEVVEVSCPAEHETRADHDLVLPTETARPERSFDGQRFVRHEAATAGWVPWRQAGFEARDTGVAAATEGLVAVRFVRAAGGTGTATGRHGAQLSFAHVVRGALSLVLPDRPAEPLVAGDAFAVPAGMEHALSDCSGDLCLLEIVAPGAG